MKEKESLIEIDPKDYDIVVKIKDEKDIVVARQMVKDFAKRLNFSLGDVTKLSTAVSELARNIYRYAGEGFIFVREINDKGSVVLEIVAYDNGPGIKDLNLAMQSGYSTTKGSFGLGLSGVKRLMDEFYINSKVDKGTVVIVKKRRRNY
ncbi:MAG: anti-sigma regulatory factor [Thermovenabulum sp.]|uniref:anti-sigma regulatory factor n=1 Tax=Thermovenabulum sp. TaxID=3100335 RepID=UPI003C7DE0FC